MLEGRGRAVAAADRRWSEVMTDKHETRMFAAVHDGKVLMCFPKAKLVRERIDTMRVLDNSRGWLPARKAGVRVVPVLVRLEKP
jgi:hypothetical protein